MNVTYAGPERRARSRNQESTRFFRKPALPAVVESPPRAWFPSPQPEVYFLAPSPWPRGQFLIDPEGQRSGL